MDSCVECSGLCDLHLCPRARLQRGHLVNPKGPGEKENGNSDPHLDCGNGVGKGEHVQSFFVVNVVEDVQTIPPDDQASKSQLVHQAAGLFCGGRSLGSANSDSTLVGCHRHLSSRERKQRPLVSQVGRPGNGGGNEESLSSIKEGGVENYLGRRRRHCHSRDESSTDQLHFQKGVCCCFVSTRARKNISPTAEIYGLTEERGVVPAYRSNQ
mmetsp:Transcript_12017/g.23128  ORF Transcript_12017/g.23128 Transcript_12017/m.23128 type:complete len:212 (+) Transcript_12017:2390-3025(+)